jgi:hypothetical protein
MTHTDGAFPVRASSFYQQSCTLLTCNTQAAARMYIGLQQSSKLSWAFASLHPDLIVICFGFTFASPKSLSGIIRNIESPMWDKPTATAPLGLV